MEADRITFEDLKKQTKKAQRKIWFREKVSDAMKFLNDNKELILICGPGAFAATKAITKSMARRANLKKEQDLKELYCYDRSLGHYWKLRRELTNSEWVEIDKRKKNGERLSDILDELKVLK